MDFKAKIEEAQKALDSKRNDVAELIGMAEAEERDLSDDESIQLEALGDEIVATEKRITDLERAEKALAERVIEKQAPEIIQHRPMVDREKGELLFRQATATYLAHINKVPLEEAAKKAYPTDRGLQAVIKTANNPAATDVAGWAAELTEEANQGYLDILRGVAVTPQLWAVAGVPLRFDGYTALNVPGRAGTDTDLASGWTGQGSALPVRRAVTESQKIEPYKWGAITTMTKEIMMRSVPAIEAIVRNGMIQDTGTKLDNDYLGEAAAVAGFNPAGIMNGVVGTPAASGGATVGDDMLEDLRNLLDPFYAMNMGQTLRIMVHPSNALAMSVVLYNGTYLFRDELARGTLFGVPVIQSTNVPVDELQAIDMAHQAVASGAFEITASDTATLVEMDDDGNQPYMGQNYPRNPSGQVGDAARDTVNNPPIRSLFQTETVAIKLVQYLSWAVLRTGSVNRITGVAY